MVAWTVASLLAERTAYVAKVRSWPLLLYKLENQRPGRWPVARTAPFAACGPLSCIHIDPPLKGRMPPPSAASPVAHPTGAVAMVPVPTFPVSR